MSGYSAFARFYDMLMGDVDYAARADYLMSLFSRHNSKPEAMTLLDLACGSGSLFLSLHTAVLMSLVLIARVICYLQA